MPDTIADSTETMAPPDLSAPLTTPTPTGPAFNDAFADLDKLVEIAPDKAPDKPTTKTPAKPAQADTKPVQAEKKPAVVDKAPAETVDKKADTTDPKTAKRSPWQVVHDKEAEIATLRKQIAERDTAKPNNDWQKERADLLKRIEERDARLRERDEAIEFTAFEQSDKFKSEYEKPYSNAWNQGRATVARFQITDKDGNQRPGKAEDFDRLMALEQNDPEAAADLMAEMFGNKASYVAAHIVKVKDSFQRIQDAREDYRVRGEEDRKLKSSRSEQESLEFRERATEFGKSLTEKYADLFKPSEDDPQGKARFTDGETFANRFFNAALNNDKSIPQEQKAQIAALGYLKLQSYDLQVSRRQRAEARVKELETELEQFKASEPKAGDGAGKKVAEGDVPDWEKLLGDMAT